MAGDSPQVAHRAGLAWMPSLLGAQEFWAPCGGVIWEALELMRLGIRLTLRAGQCVQLLHPRQEQEVPAVASTRQEIHSQQGAECWVWRGPTTPPCHLLQMKGRGAAHTLHPASLFGCLFPG